MSASTIPVICYYNGQIVRTKTDVEYEGSETCIVPLKIPIECTFQELLDMIYSKTLIDKRRFKLVLICKYPLRNGNRFQPFQVRDDSSVREMLDLVIMIQPFQPVTESMTLEAYSMVHVMWMPPGRTPRRDALLRSAVMPNGQYGICRT